MTFLVDHRVQTGCAAYSYPMTTGGFSPRVKRPGREAPSSAEFKNTWNYT